MLESHKRLLNIAQQSVPGLSIDCVVLGFENQKLHVLLLKWRDLPKWALPGGFVFKDEDMDQAVGRILKQRTGLPPLFLSQFWTFGEVNRRSSEDLKQMTSLMSSFPEEVKVWFQQRFVTTGYFALADMSQCLPIPDDLSDRCEWIEIDLLPDLILDHDEVINKALEKIRVQLNYLPFGISLLPEKFTMGNLQSLYEGILSKKLDRGNFQKKMLKLGIFNRLEKQLSGGAHKAPYLYEFDREKYDELLICGIGFM